MYAIKQTYGNYNNPGLNFVRVLKKRYKTLRNAEQQAKQWCWRCRPATGGVVDESDAEVIIV